MQGTAPGGPNTWQPQEKGGQHETDDRLGGCDFGVKSWHDVLTDCNTLADDGSTLTDGSAAGDWRLPNIRELSSLSDLGEGFPALPAGHPFLSVPNTGSYWVSTTFIGNTDSAYRVYLGSGTFSIYDKVSYTYRVWPVRDPG